VTAHRRAARLVRWYPTAWRDRYGDEFVALLVDDIGERSISARRALDVARAGCVAHWRCGGLARDSVPQTAQTRAVAWVLGASGVFLFFANALWSQLMVDWQWGRPWSVLTEIGIAVMTVALAAVTALAVGLAVLAFVRAMRTGSVAVRRLVVPTAVCVVGLVVLLVGAAHFSPGWPGTSGHPWSLRGMVPGGVGAFSWAATLSVTSYWFHLHELGAFPTAELAWMIVSPLAVIAVIGGGATAVARLGSPMPRTRAESRLVRTIGWSMVSFGAGAALWLGDDAPFQPHYMFHKGFIDIVDVVIVAATVLIARRARAALSSNTAAPDTA
jgi:hypothetical protein